jgi:hypothetical protein
MIRLLTCALILSEILVNEPGGTVSLEWIELQAIQPVNLSNYKLIVNGDTLDLSPQALDSSQYVVVVRDSVRFEQYFGDSSGTWGDALSEQYILIQRSFSMANSVGVVTLVSPNQTDRFEYAGTAGDGISYERISDAVWQVTSDHVKTTPGARNDGAPVRYDWGIVRAFVSSPVTAHTNTVSIDVHVQNLGRDSSKTVAVRSSSLGQPLDSQWVFGIPDSIVKLSFGLQPQHGINSVRIRLSDDDRLSNNTKDIHFHAGDPPFIFSEIYAAPLDVEPEWIELFVTSDTAISATLIRLTDHVDTLPVSTSLQYLYPGEHVVLTGNQLALRMKYDLPESQVLEISGFPTLNNAGDQLSILLESASIDSIDYPSMSNSRGTSYERVGNSDAWGFSVDPEGSTPGRTNSIDVVYSPDIFINVSPNPFAPGLGEHVIISYTVPFNAFGELMLYGGDGHHLRTLIQNAPLVSGHYTWDGRDQSGRLLPVGIYLLQMRLTKPMGFTKLSTVVIAR